MVRTVFVAVAVRDTLAPPTSALVLSVTVPLTRPTACLAVAIGTAEAGNRETGS